jgi:adenosine deaminase
MFFNPTSHTMHGIPYATVIDGILDGVRCAEKDFGVRCRLIAAIHRGHSPAAAQAMIEEVVAGGHDEIIGLGSDALPADGSEGLPYFRETYSFAKRHGLRVSAHCAELPGTSRNFNYALDVLKCDRIDHGYRVLDDPSLVERAKAEGIWFTCCPSATAWVYGWPDLSRHPIRAMVEQGLNVTLNSDDPPMFETDIGREFVKSCPAMGFSPTAAAKLALNGVEAAWMDEGERRALRREFEQEIDALLAGLAAG